MKKKEQKQKQKQNTNIGKVGIFHNKSLELANVCINFAKIHIKFFTKPRIRSLEKIDYINKLKFQHIEITEKHNL